MAFNDRVLYNSQSTAVGLNGVNVGLSGPGPTLLVNRVRLGTLSALVVVDAETNTITLTPKWQVSADSSTWVDVYQPNSPANVLWATGTAGADAPVTRVLTAPDAVYAFRYARVAIEVGVTNGLAADVGNIGYNYQLDDLV